MRRCHKQGGFSLIELSIVLVIIGLLMVPIIQAYDLYLKQRILNKTAVAMDDAKTSVTAFYDALRRYPCPSDPSAPRNWTDPFDATATPTMQFGGEYCDARTLPMGTCSGPGGTGVCRIAAGIDLDDDGDNTDDAILIGALPYLDIGMTVNDALDGHGQLLTYIVTEQLLDETTFDIDAYGVNLRSLPAPSALNPTPPPVNSRVPYLIISHGENRMGAYTPGRFVAVPCAGTVGVDGLDIENCDGDNQFVSDYGRNDNPANYYDDKVVSGGGENEGLWIQLTGNDIRNNNVGRVGVGTGAPVAELDVAGNIRANQIQAEEVCNVTADGSGENCFRPEVIGGTGFIECSSGQVMEGISLGAARCVTPPTVNISTPIDYSCPTDEYAIGIRSDGTLICSGG